MPAHRRLPFAACLAAAACATAGAPAPRGAVLPEYLLDPEGKPHPDCPPSASFLAVGSSRAGRNEARERARAAVVRRISSDIVVETVRLLETSDRDGEVRQMRELQERTRERARFDHANLVRTVGAPGTRDGEVFVLACLDRRVLARTLEAELEPAMVRFRTAAGRALLPDADRGGFVLGHAEAMRQVPVIVPLLAQLRAVLGDAAPGEAEFRASWARLVEEAARMRGRVVLRLALDAEGLPADAASEVTEGVRATLASTGVRAELGEAVCPGEEVAPPAALQASLEPVAAAGGLATAGAKAPVPAATHAVAAPPGVPAGTPRLEPRPAAASVPSGPQRPPVGEGPTHVLQLHARPECRWAAFGHTCRIHVSGRARSCGDGRTVFSGPIAGDAQGVDARDPGRALRKALRRISAGALAPGLRRMLASEVPLGGEPEQGVSRRSER